MAFENFCSPVIKKLASWEWNTVLIKQWRWYDDDDDDDDCHINFNKM